VSVPREDFYNASGIDRDSRAKMALVWRVRGPDNCLLLGSDRLVGALGHPKGIQAGQFSITFALPTARAADEVVVTDDANGASRLPAVILPPRSAFEFKPGGDSCGGRAAAVTSASPQYPTIT
jgi:hypothetical protein